MTEQVKAPPERVWIDPAAPKQMYFVERYEPLAEHLVEYIRISPASPEGVEVAAKEIADIFGSGSDWLDDIKAIIRRHVTPAPASERSDSWEWHAVTCNRWKSYDENHSRYYPERDCDCGAPLNPDGLIELCIEEGCPNTGRHPKHVTPAPSPSGIRSELEAEGSKCKWIEPRKGSGFFNAACQRQSRFMTISEGQRFCMFCGKEIER